jgi:hypothetical protein
MRRRRILNLHPLPFEKIHKSKLFLKMRKVI